VAALPDRVAHGAHKRFTGPAAIPGKLNLVLCAACVLVSAGCWALPVVVEDSWAALLAGALGFALLKEPLFGLLHEADHRILHPHRRVNDALGIVLAATLPSSYRYHRLAHLTHHAYNRCKRERVEYYSAAQSRFRRNVFYYAVLMGLMWVGLVLTNVFFTILPQRLVKKWRLDTDFAQPLPPLGRADLTAIRLEFAGVLAFHAGLLAFTPVSALQLAVFLYASALSYSLLRHVVHYGASFDVIEGSFDLRAPRFLWPLLLHGNLHLAHHRHPSVPWLHLPHIADPADARFGYFEMVARQWRGVLSEAEQLADEAGQNVRTLEPGSADHSAQA
jgi:fatty acid desaturase